MSKNKSFVGKNTGSDVSFFVSGSINGAERGRGVAVMGGDLIASGSFRAKQLFYNNCKYSDTGGAGSPRKMFVRWGANGADNAPGSNNRFVVPYSGRLYKVLVRSSEACGNTTIGFHKAGDGTNLFSATPSSTKQHDMNVDDTSFTFDFEDISANFNAGEILGISMDPQFVVNDVDITVVWELETYKD